ncbi:unnamed protein product [Orchesella dallaii]|uniref:CCHC-type domain-containing protein n=1 Tax=Orchesella dallaii TaxID=48710 RepID=A0ABP1RQK0_9HEXA
MEDKNTSSKNKKQHWKKGQDGQQQHKQDSNSKCPNCGSASQNRKDCQHKDIKCFSCGNMGHFSSMFRKKQNNRNHKPRNSTPVNSTNTVDTLSECDVECRFRQSSFGITTTEEGFYYFPYVTASDFISAAAKLAGRPSNVRVRTLAFSFPSSIKTVLIIDEINSAESPYVSTYAIGNRFVPFISVKKKNNAFLASVFGTSIVVNPP